MLQTGQIVTGVSGYVVVVSPGVRHPYGIYIVTRSVASVREIFGLPVILTNINIIKLKTK